MALSELCALLPYLMLTHTDKSVVRKDPMHHKTSFAAEGKTFHLNCQSMVDETLSSLLQ